MTAIVLFMVDETADRGYGLRTRRLHLLAETRPPAFGIRALATATAENG
jgi:hypothetical protein